MELKNYMKDGANYQARAVLCFLSAYDEIEESWNDELKEYEARPEVARWENCREQGYIVFLKSKDYQNQINIIFFEHRNSDSICAVLWEQNSMNSLTIETARFGDVYKTKYDTSKSVGAGKVDEMATWIWEKLTAWWIENN